MVAMVNADQGRAAAFLARVNLAIIRAAGARRQGRVGVGASAPGARPPAALAGAPVHTKQLVEPGPEGKVRPVTPLGYKTAVRSVPRILAALDAADPRRRAAVILADTVERIGSVKGSADALQGSAPKSAISDGGATTRVKYSARLRLIEALANGWQVERSGKVRRGPERVALEVGRQTGKLQEIKAFQALMMMCVDGISADEILRRHGWAAKSKVRRRLADALLASLDDVADGLGLGRWAKQNG